MAYVYCLWAKATVPEMDRVHLDLNDELPAHLNENDDRKSM